MMFFLIILKDKKHYCNKKTFMHLFSIYNKQFLINYINMNKKTILSKIKDLATSVVNLKTVDAEKIEVKAEEVKLEQQTLDNGTIVEAESFESGQPIFIVNEEERVPLPVGEYEKEGMILVVTEEGMIAEIKEAVAEEADPEVDAGEVYVTVEDFNKAIDEIKAMLSKDKDELEKVEEELVLSKEKEVKLQKELDEVPDAAPIKNRPKKVKLNSAPKTSKGRIMQAIKNNR